MPYANPFTHVVCVRPVRFRCVQSWFSGCNTDQRSRLRHGYRYCTTRLALSQSESDGEKYGSIDVDPARSRPGVALLAVSIVLSVVYLVLLVSLRKHFAAVYKHAVRAAGGDDDSNGQDAKGSKQQASLGRLLRLARPEYPLLGIGMVMLVFSSASSVAAPLFLGHVIDAASKGDQTRVNRYIAILGGIYVVGAVATFLRWDLPPRPSR